MLRRTRWFGSGARLWCGREVDTAPTSKSSPATDGYPEGVGGVVTGSVYAGTTSRLSSRLPGRSGRARQLGPGNGS